MKDRGHVNASRIKRSGASVSFFIFSQRGTLAAVKQPDDRGSSIRTVDGECVTGAYRTSMYATFDGENREVAIQVQTPGDPKDRLLPKDLDIVCRERWASDIVSDPVQETGIRFEAARIRRQEHSALRRG